MIPSLPTVDLSRWQFALDALFHFLFVPLTLGLTLILFAMELTYVITDKPVYKDMTIFWGKLLGINFALGVLTGITMEFQFGTNWAYYSQYVGDIFGTPLAIEGLVAFMLESTFLGLFFFGWNKLSKKQHLLATLCLAVGSSMSALLILIANGFMQHPVGANFNFHTMRMETASLWQLFMNPMAQIGFAHTIVAGYTTGAVFVLGISGYYLLRNRDTAFAKRSFAIAAGIGIIASSGLLFLGDLNGQVVYKSQPMKLAAIEAEWNTNEAPSAFNLITWPSQEQRRNLFSIQIPYALSVIVTHSLDKRIDGINNILARNEQRVQDGIQAVVALDKLRTGDTSPAVLAEFKKHEKNLGFGLLLKNYTNDVAQATPQDVHSAALDTIPSVPILFWTFRIMVGLGLLMCLMFIIAFIGVLRNGKVWRARWLWRWALWSIPFPFIASNCGWIVTELGRQPWTVYHLLPTRLSSSAISPGNIAFTLMMFVSIYTILFIVELYLMFKFGRMGPSAIHTGQYHFEQPEGKE